MHESVITPYMTGCNTQSFYYIFIRKSLQMDLDVAKAETIKTFVPL